MSRLAAPGLLASLVAAARSQGAEGAYATLPPVGASLPAFDFPEVTTARVTAGALLGAPAVVALWSGRCAASRDALAAITALRDEYGARGVRVVLLTDDADPAALRLLAGVAPGLPVGLAAGELAAAFSQTALGPWRRPLPLPAFLLVDRAGRVVHRQVGVEQAPAQRLLDLSRRVGALLADESDA